MGGKGVHVIYVSLGGGTHLQTKSDNGGSEQERRRCHEYGGACQKVTGKGGGWGRPE